MKKFIIIFVLILLLFLLHYPRTRIRFTETINITKSYVITTNSEKGNQRIKLLRKNFSRYVLPEIEIHYAIPGSDVDYSKFHPKIKDFLMQSQISLCYAMYQVLEKIANGPDEWCYFFEDDARVVNVKEGFDLIRINNVPNDAEMIVFSRGTKNKIFEGSMIDVKETWGGVNMHGQLVSKEGAKKFIKALNPMWTAIDVQLYKCSCDWKHEVSVNQTEYDLKRDDEHCSKLGDDNIKNEIQKPCIKMYESVMIFEQTSNPTRFEEDYKKNQEKILNNECDYAIHPLDWIQPEDYKNITQIQ